MRSGTSRGCRGIVYGLDVICGRLRGLVGGLEIDEAV